MGRKINLGNWVPEQYLYKVFKIDQEGNNLILNNLHRVTEGGKRIRKSLYMGILIPGGFLKGDETVSLAKERREYGFTNALLSMCPLSLKNEVGENWFDYLLAVIEIESPTSYLLDRPRKRIGNEIAPFRRRLVKSMDFSLDQLKEWFGGLEILKGNGITLATPMSEFQREKARELGITHMEVLR